MVRLYGPAPYRPFLLHGGPGAVGSLQAFAAELSRRSGLGVAEALQSRYSVAELIAELSEQITANGAGKAVLIGHSWGAWLAALFAQAHPEQTEKMILVGCGPLQVGYVHQITERRLQNIPNEQDRVIFRRLIENQASADDLSQIPRILAKADHYCLDAAPVGAVKADSNMYASVWGEAAQLRASGELLTAFTQIRCPICVIQGAQDPHPAAGVRIPLAEAGVPCRFYVLEQCGHSPYDERYAREEFYRVLLREIAE